MATYNLSLLDKLWGHQIMGTQIMGTHYLIIRENRDIHPIILASPKNSFPIPSFLPTLSKIF